MSSARTEEGSASTTTSAADGFDPAAALLGLTMAGGEDTIYVSAVDSGAVVQQVLHALDATTGSTRWSYEPAACDPATPETLVAGGPPLLGCAGSPLDPVVAGAIYLGDVATVRALDVASGAELWATPLGSFTVGLSAGPSVVVVQLPPEGTNPGGSPLPGELVALAPADGTVMWRRPFGGYGPVATGELVAAFDQSSLAPTPDQPVLPPGAGVTALAFDAASGSAAWERTLPGVFPATNLTAVGDLLVYSDTASTTPSLSALDARTGEDRWLTEHANPAVDDAHPFGGSYVEVQASPDGQVLVGLIPAEAPYKD